LLSALSEHLISQVDGIGRVPNVVNLYIESPVQGRAASRPRTGQSVIRHF
jgi:hypothetical protein